MKNTAVVCRSSVVSPIHGLVALVTLLGASFASAQNISGFLTQQGGAELTNSNLGQSALAIQRTCGALGPSGLGGFALTGSAGELFLRCNELVATADGFVGGTLGLPRILGYSDGDELLAAFQNVNGEEVQATSTMAANASSDQFSSIAARLGALRGATSASITSVAANGSDFMFGSGGGAAADDGDMGFGPWGWFVRGTYTTGDRDPSEATAFVGAENGFEFDQAGLTVGIDHSSGTSVWGVALSYSSYEVQMNTVNAVNARPIVSGGKIETDSVNGSFYFDFTGRGDVYVSVLTGYGTQSFDMARNFLYFAPAPGAPDVVDQTRVLAATPDGDSIAGSFTVGRVINRGGFVIDPRVGVTFDRITIDRFAEVDSGNTNISSPVAAMQLSFAEQKIDSLRANIGIQLSNNVNTSFGSIRPTFSADWYHEFEDDPRIIQVKYALEDTLASQGAFTTGFNGCVSCFNLRSEAPDADFFVVGAGLAAAFAGGTQAFFMVEGLLGYDNLSAYAVTLGLRGQF